MQERALKFTLLLGLATSILANLLIAAVFWLVYLHYDGDDFGTNALLLGLASFSIVVPALACLYPLHLKLQWRLMISLVPLVVGSVTLATHG